MDAAAEFGDDLALDDAEALEWLADSERARADRLGDHLDELLVDGWSLDAAIDDAVDYEVGQSMAAVEDFSEGATPSDLEQDFALIAREAIATLESSETLLQRRAIRKVAPSRRPRQRASRGCSTRTRGSRRTTSRSAGGGSGGSSDDDGESEPSGGRHEHLTAAPIARGRLTSCSPTRHPLDVLKGAIQPARTRTPAELADEIQAKAALPRATREDRS